VSSVSQTAVFKCHQKYKSNKQTILLWKHVVQESITCKRKCGTGEKCGTEPSYIKHKQSQSSVLHLAML
jgi:hypothetical protein